MFKRWTARKKIIAHYDKIQRYELNIQMLQERLFYYYYEVGDHSNSQNIQDTLSAIKMWRRNLRRLKNG